MQFRIMQRLVVFVAVLLVVGVAGQSHYGERSYAPKCPKKNH